ncbi:general secretion pathway protein GspK [Verrucomicrobiota bacterium]
MNGLKPGSEAERGSALVVVIWVVGLLSLLISSFAFDAHIEAKLTSYRRKRTKADGLAESGLEIAGMLMARSTEIEPGTEDEPEEGDEWYEYAKRLAEGHAVSNSWPLGEGEVTVAIQSERARRAVNYLDDEEEWEGVLEVAEIPEEIWPELIESVLDWTDQDDDPRVDGAEADYYEDLDPPYRPSNGPLFAVEELLQVRGFTRDILYSSTTTPLFEGEAPRRKPRLIDLLTEYGSDDKVNVNAASTNVLMTLPHEDIDLIVEAIVSEREGEDAYFRNDTDLFRRVPSLNTPILRRYVTTEASEYYRITSVGKVQGVARKVWCIVSFDRGAKKLTFVRWREED